MAAQKHPLCPFHIWVHGLVPLRPHSSARRWEGENRMNRLGSASGRGFVTRRAQGFCCVCRNPQLACSLHKVAWGRSPALAAGSLRATGETCHSKSCKAVSCAVPFIWWLLCAVHWLGQCSAVGSRCANRTLPHMCGSFLFFNRKMTISRNALKLSSKTLSSLTERSKWGLFWGNKRCSFPGFSTISEA